MKFEARELSQENKHRVVDYWMNCSKLDLERMGADIDKMPSREQFTQDLKDQVETPYEKKKAFATIWYNDDEAIGHCNVNKIKYGEEAYMHLHLWKASHRQKGMGQILIGKSIALFFEKLELETLFCEPFAENPAPNKTLPKAGFSFRRSYFTKPGYLNFPQTVNLWELSKEAFLAKSEAK